MKRHIYIISLLQLFLVVLCLATACSERVEDVPEGWLHVSPPSMEPAQKVRVASETVDIDYLVSITRGNVTVMEPVRFSSITGSIPLSSSSGYKLLAESCSKAEAESQPTLYGQPRYAGSSLPFSIEPNTHTTVDVYCTMANAAFCVVKDQSFYYQEFEVTASVGSRTLTFNNETQVGYFNVGESGTAELQYKVRAVDSEGRVGRGEGKITLMSRNLSKLCMKATPKGYVDVTITYDDTFTPEETDIFIGE